MGIPRVIVKNGVAFVPVGFIGMDGMVCNTSSGAPQHFAHNQMFIHAAQQAHDYTANGAMPTAHIGLQGAGLESMGLRVP